jgi:starvation-inducible DNA-binding protein
VVAERSKLPHYPLDIVMDEEHVEALSTALAAFGRAVRAGIDEVDELGDAGSTDLLTEISRGNDQWLWFVESHQARRDDR